MTGLYETLEFPALPEGRPFTYLNVVTTLDGKSVGEGREASVMGLGSTFDQATMRNLESHADAVLIGARTVRATPNMWYAPRLRIFLLTKSGNLPWTNRVFRDRPENVTIVGPSSLSIPADHGHLIFDGVPQNLIDVACHVRKSGISRLLVEGGSQVNGLFLSQDLVDEIFWTIAPKIRLGDHEPNLANHETAFRGEDMLRFRLVSSQLVDDELFLRYRRSR